MTVVTDWVQAIAVVIASGVAAYSVNAWRREMIGRRRAEVAEAALADFYEARDLLQSARSPFARGNEGQTRPRIDGETEDQARYRDAIFAPAERILAKTEFYSRFAASKYRFMAVFGVDTGRHFDSAIQARNRVILSTEMLIREHVDARSREWRAERLAAQAGTDPNAARELERARERQSEWEADIGWGDPHEDRIRTEMNRAIVDMEGICSPVILGQGRGWWGRLRARE